jgi:hypothetical protein
MILYVHGFLYVLQQMKRGHDGEFFAAVCDERWRKTLVCTPAHTLLHGSVNTQELADHWYRPLRFFSGQEHALGVVKHGHPGLYRQMARTTPVCAWNV